MKQYSLTPTCLYDEARRRKKELEGVYSAVKQRVSKYPAGRIHVWKSSGWLKYYLRTDSADKTGQYISKRQESKIRLYLQKKYDQDILNALSNEIVELDRFLTRADKGDIHIQEIYTKAPEEIRKFLCPIDMSNADFQEKWMSIPYEGKKIPDNIPQYFTEKGEQVRSKSELNIANALFRHGIPYKYECPLRLSDGNTIYPDFTLFDVRRRKELYWEHRGMMDDRMYALHAVQRTKSYQKSGIFPGDRLIFTEETSGSPLGTDEIESVIRHYFTEIPK